MPENGLREKLRQNFNAEHFQKCISPKTQKNRSDKGNDPYQKLLLVQKLKNKPNQNIKLNCNADGPKRTVWRSATESVE